MGKGREGERAMRARQWVLFGTLGLIWGSSFLWIKIGVQESGPVTLMAMRTLTGVIGLGLIVALRRPAFRISRRIWLVMLLLGITNTAIPFTLISWGEQFIDSGVASILNGTVPLFTVIIAHLFLHDDRMTVYRVLGLLTGFAGVVILVSRDLGSSGLQGNVLGQLAVLLAAISYALSSVFARRNLREVDSMVQAFVPLASASAATWMGALALESPIRLPSLPITWAAVAWLGLLGSCVAYLIYFYLIHAIGPTRTTMVTYVFPVVGPILGIVFLGEKGDLRLALGAGLVAAGIWFASLKQRPARERVGLFQEQTSSQ